MKRIELVATMLLMAVWANGCGPASSLFALYTEDDKFFDENLLGEWRQVSGQDKESDKNGRWVFQRDGDSTVYKTSLITLGKQSGFLAEGRLVQLGKAVFVDFGPDTSAFDNGDMPVPYPFIESHMIGRIWIEKDTVRINFLSDDWIRKQLKNGRLALAYAGSTDSPVLNTSTAELRKFALEHVDDKEAFSENFELARVK